MSEAVTYLIVLDCHHEIRFGTPPVLGEEIYCSRCRHYRRVIDAPAEIRLRCNGCRYSRSFGAAKLAAQQAADRHANNHGHEVRVTNGRELVSLHRPPAEALSPWW